MKPIRLWFPFKVLSPWSDLLIKDSPIRLICSGYFYLSMAKETFAARSWCATPFPFCKFHISLTIFFLKRSLQPWHGDLPYLLARFPWTCRLISSSYNSACRVSVILSEFLLSLLIYPSTRPTPNVVLYVNHFRISEISEHIVQV